MAKDSKRNQEQENLKRLENKEGSRFEGTRDLNPDDFEDFEAREKGVTAESEFERIRNLNPDDFEDFEAAKDFKTEKRANKDSNKK
ncbi:hypothetical protein MWH28_08070 [Natroniella sulfidigena]|uniref:hypothetical protein n=1 Tax=Natroniella sulfidigena TaxID=723921 RepID=UPI00200B9EA6|nr:hypothetical protein [Natroniella sulfidigena]MCK8817317.1 hypothetical protein [Natroniella sulfidigena]